MSVVGWLTCFIVFMVVTGEVNVEGLIGERAEWLSFTTLWTVFGLDLEEQQEVFFSLVMQLPIFFFCFCLISSWAWDTK